MKDIALNAQGYPIYENGDYHFIYDKDVVIQQAYITLASRLREFEPDTTLGLEQNNLFGKNVVSDYVEQDIQDALLDQVDEIDSVDSIDLDFDAETRILTVNVSFTTTSFGAIEQDYDIDL